MSFTILNANANHIPLTDNSVQCVVTSPPYWGLRDFGQVGQIGLESTPDEYVAKIVAVFAEVWRVLRDDGTCWVNLGDSYAANGSTGGNARKREELTGGGCSTWSTRDVTFHPKTTSTGLKPKDLVGIPWRVAFALQAAGAASPATMLAVDKIRTALLDDFDDWEQVPDKTRNVIEALDREWHDAHRGGWYLRSDIIWSKPNPMPESVTDRPTKAHEYIFLLTKREKYFYDADAIREPHAETRWSGAIVGEVKTLNNSIIQDGLASLVGKKWTPNTRDYNPAGRNIRTVWEIATQPYPEAHFATFPEEIAVRCIKAGTSEKGACKECGAPWERVTRQNKLESFGGGDLIQGKQKEWKRSSHCGADDQANYQPPVTIGWQPTCKHDAESVPCVVLDPFSGAGTVPLVADKLNRRGIGLELKIDYCRMAHDRCYDDAPLLAAMEG